MRDWRTDEDSKKDFLRKRMEKNISEEKDLLSKAKYMVEVMENRIEVMERELQKYI